MNYYVVTIGVLILTILSIKTTKALLDIDRVAPIFMVTLCVLYMMSVYMPFPHNGITDREIYPKTVIGNRVVNPIFSASDIAIDKTYIIKDGNEYIEASLDPEYKNLKDLTEDKFKMVDGNGNKYITWLEQIEGSIVEYKTPEEEIAEVELNSKLKDVERWRTRQSIFLLGLCLLSIFVSLSPEVEDWFRKGCYT